MGWEQRLVFVNQPEKYCRTRPKSWNVDIVRAKKGLGPLGWVDDAY